jgi:hypothetical protein
VKTCAPYAEKIYLLRSGTQAQPIRVCGVPNAEGKLPVVTGKDATTRAELQPIIGDDPGRLSGFENLGVVTIIARPFDEQVSYVQVGGLHITGTLVGDTTDTLNKFRDSRGAEFRWDDALRLRAHEARGARRHPRQRNLPTRHGTKGGNHLKTRVAGLTARYNYFDNAPNAHLIDIVEVEAHR